MRVIFVLVTWCSFSGAHVGASLKPLRDTDIKFMAALFNQILLSSWQWQKSYSVDVTEITRELASIDRGGQDSVSCVCVVWNKWDVKVYSGIPLLDSFPRKRERSKYSSQGEDSVERSDGDRITLQVPTQRRESFLYKSDSEFELASKCVTSRHHSFSEGWVNM